MLWHKLPKSIYFRRGSLHLLHWKRSPVTVQNAPLSLQTAFLFNNGYVDEVTRVLKNLVWKRKFSFEVEADPTFLWSAKVRSR